MAARVFRNQEDADFFIQTFGDSDSDESDFRGFESEIEFIPSEDDRESDDNENVTDELSEDDLLWSRVIRDQTVAEFNLISAPKFPRTFNVETATPLEYFSLFFEETMFQKIATETNLYAERCAEEHTADNLWLPTDAAEMRAFFGLNILMGVNPKPEYVDYWSTDPFLGVSGFLQTMTVNRYEKLCQYIHCNNAAARLTRADADYHPVAKVAPVFDMARQNCKLHYQHGRDISIDEAMKGFKGRTELRMYMPAKPEKFGIKFWARCDGNTAYMSDFQLYSGKRDQTPFQRVHGLGYRVVHDMTRDLIGLNHCVYFDRFFTSIPLMESLLSENIYACGTLMTNRKGVPTEIKQKRALKGLVQNRGDSAFYQRAGITVTAWNDNNVVVIAHTCLPHPRQMVTCNRQVEADTLVVPQPEAIHRYNQHMNGVDVHDQLRKKYAASRPSKKYWKYILWFVVDVCRVNAWILYRMSSTRQVGRKKRYTQKDFILELGKALIDGFTSRKRATIRESGVRVDIDAKKHKIAHTFVRLPGKTRRCKSCYRLGRRHETVFGCAACNTHMCRDCFLRVHEHED